MDLSVKNIALLVNAGDIRRPLGRLKSLSLALECQVHRLHRHHHFDLSFRASCYTSLTVMKHKVCSHLQVQPPPFTEATIVKTSRPLQTIDSRMLILDIDIGYADIYFCPL